MKILFFLFPLFLWADGHIFLYHRFNDFRHPDTDTATKILIRQFNYLKTHGYQVVNSKKLLKMAKEGKNINKIVSFQIDDSFKSFYYNGFPIFKKYHYPFTLFVYVEGTNNKWGDFMTWKMVKEVRKYGDVEFHSYAHPHLPKLSNKQILTDTKKGLKIFEKHMGYTPDSYAYPYGEYDNRVKKILSPFFKYIYNQNEGAINKNVNLQDVPRIALTGDVKIASRLKIQHLNIRNLKIKRINNLITEVSGYVPYKEINIYITKLGWKWVKTNKGYFHYFPHFKLQRFRNRVIFKYKNKMYAKMVTEK